MEVHLLPDDNHTHPRHLTQSTSHTPFASQLSSLVLTIISSLLHNQTTWDSPYFLLAVSSPHTHAHSLTWGCLCTSPWEEDAIGTSPQWSHGSKNKDADIAANTEVALCGERWMGIVGRSHIHLPHLLHVPMTAWRAFRML